VGNVHFLSLMFVLRTLITVIYRFYVIGRGEMHRGLWWGNLRA